jgi:hypothetical protein
MVWHTPKEELEIKRLQSARMVGEWGVAPDGKEWVHWQKQATLFEVMRAAGYAERERILYFDLPGKKTAYEDCGKKLAKGCDHVAAHPGGKIFVRLGKRSCNRKSCPICFEGWASREAERATIRLATYVVGPRVAKNTLERISHDFQAHPPRVLHGAIVGSMEEMIQEGKRSPIHLMLSPPQDLYDGKNDPDLRVFRALRKAATEFAKKAHFRGGSMIFHPYRLKCPDCGLAYPDYHKECSCGSQRKPQWFWSPHFHCVGFGWIQHTKELYEEHGWVIRNLGIRKSVFWTFQYLLSHAGVAQGVHTTTWFGELGYHAARMKGTPKMEAVREICPHCGQPLKPLEWIGGEDRGPPEYDEELAKKDPYSQEFLASSGDWRAL